MTPRPGGSSRDPMPTPPSAPTEGLIPVGPGLPTPPSAPTEGLHRRRPSGPLNLQTDQPAAQDP